MNSNNSAYQYNETYDELIDGKIVMMTPRPAVNHNIVSGNIFHIFKNYLSGKTCMPFSNSADLYLSENNRFVPNGMIVCDRSKIKYDGIYGAPNLVIEVLSPNTAKNDRGKKKDAYESAGVREYWIVNPAEKSIEVYLLNNDKYILDNVYSIFPDYELKKMNEDELASITAEFKCSLYDNLYIKLDDVFEDLF